MLDEKQSEPLIKKYGNPNPPLWQRPETSIQIANRKGLASKEENEEDQKRRQEADARESEQRNVTLALYLTSKILGNSHYVTPEDTDERIQANAKILTIWNIKRCIEDEKYEIQRATEAIKLRKNGILSEETRKKAENGETVEVPDGNNSFKLIPAHDYPFCGEEAKADVAVFEEATDIRKRRIQIYETELASRRDSPKVKENIAKMKQLAKRATIVRPTVVKTNSEIMRALEHGEPSIQLCEHFIENLEEFNEAKNEYSSLRHKLESLTDETANVPTFPPDLTVSEVGRAKSNADRILKHVNCGR